MGKKYPQIIAGSWNKVSFPEGYFMGCCDCGLVHKLRFKVSKKGNIYMQAFREEKETQYLRRRNIKPIKHGNYDTKGN